MQRSWLKEIRENKDLPQKLVARSIGITQTHYSTIESGKRRPSVETAKKIADVLGFDWTMFFEDKASRKTRL
jgi:transcriptional regulator with XRE-family HTH domain